MSVRPSRHGLGCFAKDFDWVRFVVVCFLYKTIPTREKMFLLWARKVAQNAAFLPNFSWVGLALGWGVRGLQTIIDVFSSPHDMIWLIANAIMSLSRQVHRSAPAGFAVGGAHHAAFRRRGD